MLATRIAREQGADEALLVTPHGCVLEGPTTSFFYVRGGALYTPPLALATFQNADEGIDYGALTAGAAIITAPIVVLFLIAQRRFVTGISGGELPG